MVYCPIIFLTMATEQNSDPNALGFNTLPPVVTITPESAKQLSTNQLELRLNVEHFVEFVNSQGYVDYEKLAESHPSVARALQNEKNRNRFEDALSRGEGYVEFPIGPGFQFGTKEQLTVVSTDGPHGITRNTAAPSLPLDGITTLSISELPPKVAYVPHPHSVEGRVDRMEEILTKLFGLMIKGESKQTKDINMASLGVVAMLSAPKTEQTYPERLKELQDEFLRHLAEVKASDEYRRYVSPHSDPIRFPG